VPPVSTLMKVGAARAALLAVKATAAANRPRRLLMRMDTTPFLLGVFRSDRRPPNNLAGAVPLPKNRAPGPLPGARQGRRGAAIGKKPLIAVMQSARIRLTFVLHRASRQVATALKAVALHLLVEGAARQLQQGHHLGDVALATQQRLVQALRLEGFHLRRQALSGRRRRQVLAAQPEHM